MSTHIIILIDVSYSMQGHIDDFIVAANNFISKLPYGCKITIVQFSNVMDYITYYSDDIILNKSQFNVNGTTSLYDAIVKTIKRVSTDNNIPQNIKTNMYIISDGDDNASFYHTKADADNIINEAINIGKWNIVHCHTDLGLFNVPTITYNVDNICDIFNTLHITRSSPTVSNN